MLQRVAETQLHRSQVPRLPIDSAKSCHDVEMPISAQNWKSVLAAERCDPDIIGRNRSSSFLEFRAKRGVINGRLLVHVKDAVIRRRIIDGRWRFRRPDLDALFANAPRKLDFAEENSQVDETVGRRYK